jgi:hypothetical protein
MRNYRRIDCDGSQAMAKSQTLVSTVNKVLFAMTAVSVSSEVLADWVKIAANEKFTV